MSGILRLRDMTLDQLHAGLANSEPDSFMFKRYSSEIVVRQVEIAMRAANAAERSAAAARRASWAAVAGATAAWLTVLAAVVRELLKP